MKLHEILNSETLSLSFEVFPPKTDASFDSVEQAVHEIAARIYARDAEHL